MKRIVFAAAMAAVLAGCVYYAPTGGARVAFYDGAYGDYHNGFWGDDGAFYYYTDAAKVTFARDDAHHFRPQVEHGFYQVAVMSRPFGYHRVEASLRGDQAANAP